MKRTPCTLLKLPSESKKIEGKYIKHVQTSYPGILVYTHGVLVVHGSWLAHRTYSASNPARWTRTSEKLLCRRPEVSADGFKWQRWSNYVTSSISTSPDTINLPQSDVCSAPPFDPAVAEANFGWTSSTTGHAMPSSRFRPSNVLTIRPPDRVLQSTLLITFSWKRGPQSYLCSALTSP